MHPMLSATAGDLKLLKYPLLASPKLDGIRAIVQDGKLMSRNLKRIRNAYTQAKFGMHAIDGLDGELIDGAHDATVFRRTTSSVSRAMGEPKDVKFWVFDVQMPNAPFKDRYGYLSNTLWPQGVKVVPHKWVNSPLEAQAFEEECLNMGFEGIMLRDPEGPYKEGRSTLREGYLMKVKRFEDAEAEIVGFEERMHNANELTRDELGRAKRSHHAENMVGRGDLGALLVRGINGQYEGCSFSIGTGFDDHDRATFWSERTALVGKVVKYKFFPMGSKEAPRFPVFLGFREQGT